MFTRQIWHDHLTNRARTSIAVCLCLPSVNSLLWSWASDSSRKQLVATRTAVHCCTRGHIFLEATLSAFNPDAFILSLDPSHCSCVISMLAVMVPSHAFMNINEKLQVTIKRQNLNPGKLMVKVIIFLWQQILIKVWTVLYRKKAESWSLMRLNWNLGCIPDWGHS